MDTYSDIPQRWGCWAGLSFHSTSHRRNLLLFFHGLCALECSPFSGMEYRQGKRDVEVEKYGTTGLFSHFQALAGCASLLSMFQFFDRGKERGWGGDWDWERDEENMKRWRVSEIKGEIKRLKGEQIFVVFWCWCRGAGAGVLVQGCWWVKRHDRTKYWGVAMWPYKGSEREEDLQEFHGEDMRPRSAGW